MRLGVRDIRVWVESVRGDVLRPRLAAALSVFILVVSLLIVIVYLPELAIDSGSLSRTDWLKAVQDLRTTILQGFGGLALLGTLYFSARTLQLNRRGQLTERFTKAIDQLGQLGPEKLAVRLGGIFALEQIALDSEELHWPVMEVLTAFLRETSRTADSPASTTAENVTRERPIGPRAELLSAFLLETSKFGSTPTGRAVRQHIDKESPAPGGNSQLAWPPLATDLQAIATVLGRRPADRRQYEAKNNRLLDLTRARLAGADLGGAHLEAAQLIDTHLEHSHLLGARLQGAVLLSAHLEAANLTLAQLEGASLVAANLKGATVVGGQLQGAILSGAQFQGAVLWGAHLEGANLGAQPLSPERQISGAHLEGADLANAHFKGANLEGAFLSAANLDGTDLTRAQLEVAHIDGATVLPAHLVEGSKAADPGILERRGGNER